jgi:Ran GTPase-activating protein (RanGAP) involved in mRNA processing and transport
VVNFEFIDKYLDLAADLNDYLEGRIGDEAILDRYFTEKMDPRLRTIKENIGQYLDDHERRMEDEEYRKMQRGEMEKLIHLLRLGNIKEASKINFLYASETEY